MSLLIDTKYMNIVGFQLEMFSQKKTDLWHCRCPICGDSKKNASIRRFYFHVKENNLLCYCHNCGYSHHFVVFIKDEFPSIYRDYRVEKFKDNLTGGLKRRSAPKLETHSARKPVQVSKPDKLNDLDAITDLAQDHPARVYLKERKIPYEILKGLYYTDCYATLAARFDEEAAQKMWRGEGRIVIPFLNGRNELLAVQGRSFLPGSNAKFKYITIKTNPANDKIWGLHRIDTTKPVRVVEGAVDAFFVDNCVATCDSSLWKYQNGQCYIFDNQPRNVELVKQLKKAIDMRLPVVIWPQSVSQFKDINDMVLGGISADEVDDIITKNTFTGPKALLQFNQWKKVNT